MRTSNPALSNNIFTDARNTATSATDRMTVNGAVTRTAILLLLLIATAYYSWTQSFVPAEYGQAPLFVPSSLLWIGVIGGFIIALVTIFKKTWAPVTAPFYALFEGLFLGALSAGFEAAYPGIVFQAVIATFGTLFALLFAYRSGIIKATENFKLGIFAATAGIGIVYLASIILGFFGLNVPYIHESGPIGIGFSAFVVAIAALNLVLDFDFIENGEKVGAPKYMEWYAAFGLLVTLVWLYVEILRLLSKLKSR